MGVVYGRVQDLTADMGYTNVLLIGISMKTLAFFIACWYIYMDKRYLGGLIKMGERQRNRLEAEIVDPECEFLSVCDDAWDPLIFSGASSIPSHSSDEQAMGHNSRFGGARLLGGCRMVHLHRLRHLAWCSRANSSMSRLARHAAWGSMGGSSSAAVATAAGNAGKSVFDDLLF